MGTATTKITGRWIVAFDAVSHRILFGFKDAGASLQYSLASLLRFGSTTVVEMGGEFGADPAGLAGLAGVLTT
ncbi:MAG: hypothetical protein EXQ94_00105 [Alphaproteobacteria bacterium]|nr:hypothetical protein [Alphaproteobacteria bacterium]